MVEDGTGRLCCHLCGDWFRSLGAHVRAHGHTADSYRAEMGLARSEALTQQTLSDAMSERQKKAYGEDDEFRARLAEGQRRARTGDLGRVAAAATRDTPLSIGAVARRSEALDTGRRTVAGRRLAALERMLDEAGDDDLHSYLRRRYAEGASLAGLAEETGLGRTSLRTEVQSAGIAIRRQGANSSSARRSRARAADEAAARRLGTDDLAAWLRVRRDQGWTLTALGTAVGHSSHWVRWRLEAASTARTGHKPVADV